MATSQRGGREYPSRRARDRARVRARGINATVVTSRWLLSFSKQVDLFLHEKVLERRILSILSPVRTDMDLYELRGANDLHERIKQVSNEDVVVIITTSRRTLVFVSRISGWEELSDGTARSLLRFNIKLTPA